MVTVGWEPCRSSEVQRGYDRIWFSPQCLYLYHSCKRVLQERKSHYSERVLWWDAGEGLAARLLCLHDKNSQWIEARATSQAFRLREEMVARGISPNTIIYNVLIDGLCKTGNLREAYGLWQKMVNAGFHPDCVTYTCIIHAHCERGHLKEAKEVFDYMIGNNLLIYLRRL